MSIFTIPKVRHFAIIRDASTKIHHEGDERSRTQPGHGYPAYTETIESISYEAFLERDRWEKRIRDLTISGKTFRAQEVKPVEVDLTTTVRIGPKVSAE